jgi:adenylate cyclase
MLWRKKKAAKSQERLPVGELLVKAKLITRDQLREALAAQENRSLRLAQMVVEMGFASEKDVLRVIGRHYRVKIRSFDQPWLLELDRAGWSLNIFRYLRISIKTKLSLAVTFILLATIAALGWVSLERQRQNLYEQTLRSGAGSLGYFVTYAREALQGGDSVALAQLIRPAASMEGVLYVAISDPARRVKAHTDGTLVDTKLAIPRPPKTALNDGRYVYFDYVNDYGRQVLNLTSPVMYQEKRLGQVDLGISLDFIGRRIQQEMLAIALVSAGALVLGIVVALIVGAGFSRPVSQLVDGTREIGRGNLQFKIRRHSNDELGDLALAFNYMSSELRRKQMMQESFGKYVGSDILRMILENPENQWLKGTRSSASVMFTDIRGFTSFAEDRPPERVVIVLNQYFDIATRAIMEHGGYVDKFIGDAVMGVFGVPALVANHAERCVRAALHMQKELAKAAQKTGNEVLGHVGIGINTGMLVAGNLGSQAKMEYTVIGDAVNTASRLNKLARAGDVIVSKSTLTPITRLADAEELDAGRLKGKADLVRVYRVLAVKDGLSRAKGKAGNGGA